MTLLLLTRRNLGQTPLLSSVSYIQRHDLTSLTKTFKSLSTPPSPTPTFVLPPPPRFLALTLKQLASFFNALFLLSAWSAASSDIYVSSRYLFNLARLGHAPGWMGSLYRPYGKATEGQSRPNSSADGQSLSNGVAGGDKKDVIAIPWVGILVAALFGTLAFMPDGTSAAQTVSAFLSDGVITGATI